MPLRPLQKAFLDAYADCGNLCAAAKGRESSPPIPLRLDDRARVCSGLRRSKAKAADALIHEVRHRAVQGVVKPVLYQGAPAKGDKGRPIVIREYSDNHDLRQEPYAVALHVRICAGGGQ